MTSKRASETVNVTYARHGRGLLVERATEDEQKERLYLFYTTIWIPGIPMMEKFYCSVFEGMTHKSFPLSCEARATTSSLRRSSHVTRAHSHARTFTSFAFFPTDFPGKERLLYFTLLHPIISYSNPPPPIHFPLTLPYHA